MSQDHHKTLLAEAEARIEADAARLREDPHGPNAQVVAYSTFGDMLAAAGLSRALEDEQRMRQHLAQAAQTAVEIFELTASATSSITTLPDGEEEEFVDTSATNPYTLVQGLYAALASNEEAAAKALADRDPRDLLSDQVAVSEPLLAVASAVVATIGGGQTPPSSAGALDDEQPEDRYWTTQLRVLALLAEGDRGGAEEALAAVQEASAGYWRSSGDAGSPEALLGLPELGLRALIERS